MRRSATKRWASRRTTIPTRSCRSATRWGGSDRLAVGHCPKSSISTAGASPIPESDQSGFGTKARRGNDRETVQPTDPPRELTTRVATENRIRAGADAAMGYPRFGMLDLLKLLGGLLVGLFRSHAAREAETAFLRQQLVVLKRSAPARLRLRTADRLIFVWLYRLFPSVREATVVFNPETLVRWHRSGFRLYWRWKSRRGVGRPAVPADIRDLIRTISRDNPFWGAPRIHGELLKT